MRTHRLVEADSLGIALKDDLRATKRRGVRHRVLPETVPDTPTHRRRLHEQGIELGDAILAEEQTVKTGQTSRTVNDVHRRGRDIVRGQRQIVAAGGEKCGVVPPVPFGAQRQLAENRRLVRPGAANLLTEIRILPVTGQSAVLCGFSCLRSATAASVRSLALAPAYSAAYRYADARAPTPRNR